MIRLLTNRPIRAESWQHWIFHPDPEILAGCAHSTPRASEASADPDAFTRAVSSIRIGRFHKLTRPSRLSETTRALAKQLAGLERDEIRFLDVGGSDGSTTRDAVRALGDALGKPVRATLVDRYVRLERRRSGWLREYCMSDGSPVLLRLGPLGLQLSSVHATRDPIARWLGGVYLERRARAGPPPLDRTYSLIHPKVAGDPRVEVVEWNALERNPELGGSFDAIRASNLLNESYFSRAQIERILSHLHAYLAAGGFLVISRNHLEAGAEAEHGSVWRRTGAGFERVDDFGSGSYVAHIVDELELEESER